MNYSVTGYNPYMNYGSSTRVAARNVAFTSQPNTVSSSSNNQTQSTNTGLSKNTKLGLGALALVGIGTVAYLLSRGKIGNKQVLQLAEHIEFQPAKTIEEARAFARSNLGIKRYELTNLDIANYVNEGLVNLSNSVKGTTMYSKVITLPSDSVGRMSCSFNGEILGVNEKEILESMKLENLQDLFNRVSSKFNLSNYNLNSKQLDLIAKFKTTPSKLSFKEKLEFEELIAKIDLAPSNLFKRYAEALNNDAVFNVMKAKNRVLKPADFQKLSQEEQAKYVEELFNAGYKQPIYARGAFHDINHEFGHKLHVENIGKEKFKQICVDISDNPEQAEHAMKVYMKKFIGRNPESYPILREVSGYAPFSEAEAVAEIYAGLQNGVKYSNKVMTLFDEWGGVRPLA